GIRSDSAGRRPGTLAKVPRDGHFFRRQIVTLGRTIPAARDEDMTMATSLAARVWGLDAIGAAAGTEEAQAFARRLYARVADKDLAAAPAEQRAGAALALLAFARHRLPGVAKVRVFNPTVAGHGFESRHSVVQIVNDD